MSQYNYASRFKNETHCGGARFAFACRKVLEMKVLLVNALFHPFKGGVEKHLLELSRALARKGVKVSVLTARLEGTKQYEELSGVKVHRIACTEIRLPNFYPPPVILAPDAYSKIEELDGRERFDLIHLQDRWFPDFSMALAYAKNAGKPVVVTLHNARPVGIAPHYTLFGGAFDSVFGKPVLENADLIISVSKWAVGDIAKYGLPRGKMVCVHNGVSPKEYRPSAHRAARFRKKHALEGKKILLFVGRVIRQKGIEYLIDAMPLVLKRVPQARLVVVGRGNRLEKMRSRVAKLGLQGKVHFEGFLDEEELKDALCACNVFVLPSLWEVLPVSILEAMACGKPIVASDVGGNGELVRRGHNGFLVPKKNSRRLAEKIVRVLSDEQLAGRMGRNSRERVVSEFNWELIASQTISAYQKLLRKYRAKPPEKPALPFKLVQFNESIKARLRKEYGKRLEKTLSESAEKFNESLRAVAEKFGGK